MNDAQLTITGNVATDVESGPDPHDRRVRFRLACTPRRRVEDRDHEARYVDLATTFVSVSCRGALADNVQRALTKGDPVIVSGRLRVIEHARGDSPHTPLTVLVEAFHVGHDLSRGVTSFTRVKRGEGADQAAAAGRLRAVA